ncbi:MAG: hypothetical protein HY712_07455 [candidate division NC10 bacterium]|nr:hypothetical protein [candidate division NC10 bacterium]
MDRVKRALAVICHVCPVCAYGRRHPDSPVGRVLRHPLHANHCPFWKAEREEYGPPAVHAAQEPCGGTRDE